MYDYCTVFLNTKNNINKYKKIYYPNNIIYGF